MFLRVTTPTKQATMMMNDKILMKRDLRKMANSVTF
jgi:hypothetical protein